MNTAVLPSTAGTDVFNGVVSQVTANIAPILVLIGLTVGLSLALRWFKRASRVKA